MAYQNYKVSTVKYGHTYLLGHMPTPASPTRHPPAIDIGEYLIPR